MDFKVTYLDAGLTSNYFESGNGDVGGSTASHQNGSSGGGGGGGGVGGGNGKVPKRYKAHLRDFLSSCRTKRSKAAAAAAGAAANAANAVVNDIYAAAVTAADTPPYVYPGHPGPPGHSAAGAPVGAGGYETPPSALTSYMTGQTGAAAAAALTTPYGSALYPVDNRYYYLSYQKL